MNPGRAQTARSLFLIRVAMAVGVAMFLVVSYVISALGRPPAASPSAVRTLTTAMYTAVGIAAAIIMGLRLRIDAAAPDMRRSLTVVSWAIGEFAALFGGVVLLLSGDWSAALPGALVFALALAAMRIPE